MTGRSRAQHGMIEVITSVGEEWPKALLYLTRKPETAPAILPDRGIDNFSADHSTGAEQMRDDEGVGEVHRGGSFVPG